MRIDWLKWFALAILALVLVAATGALLVARASLPRRNGEAAVARLSAPLAIDLDARAVPRIHGATFEDVLRGEGYMHAQERFFQMDLLRRSTAGELAALIGSRVLPLDRAQRPFDYRRRAHELLARLPAREQGWLAAYTDGVNAGLKDLRSRPPEYWLLGSRPDAWATEDTLLVVLGFYTRLSNNDVYERPQGVLHAALPEALYEFLTPSTSRFDRPLVGADADPTAGYVPVPIPGPEVVDLRTRSTQSRGPARRVAPPLLVPASNQWALSAQRGTRGGALLANDPHLELRLPNLFYRTELEWPDGAVRGVSIPGVPGVLLGATSALAWGATVSNADQADWVVIDVDAHDPSRYVTPEGSEPFRSETFAIAVAGGQPEQLEVETTRWGPIVARDGQGKPLALHATWLDADGLNLAVIDLSFAANVADGVAVLERWAGPSLNWALADSSGDVAWIVNGPLPRRVGFDGARPESWADGSRAWHGELPRPSVVSPVSGAVFTANNRTLPAAQAAEVSRMWMTPLRASRIAELLAQHATLSERDSLAMQLDTRARGYDQLRDIVLEVVPADERDPLLARAREHVHDLERQCGSRSARISDLVRVLFRAARARDLAAARARGRRRSRLRLSLAARRRDLAPTTRRATATLAHARVRELARVPARRARRHAARDRRGQIAARGRRAVERRELARGRASVRGVAPDRTRSAAVAHAAARAAAWFEPHAARCDAELRRADPDGRVARASRGRDPRDERGPEWAFPVAELRRPTKRLACGRTGPVPRGARRVADRPGAVR